MTEDPIEPLGTLNSDEPTLDDPDRYHHQWSNDCLYCHTKNYDPAANHGLRLWHYCHACVMVCRECQEPKPLYAFVFDYESPVYKAWREATKGKSNNSAYLGHATKEAHKDICCHCDARHQDARELLARAEATKKKQAAIDRHNTLVASASTQAALSAMLEGMKG